MSRTRAVAAWLPILIALLLPAAALGMWLPAVLGLLALGAGRLLSVSPQMGRLQEVIALGLGALVGVVAGGMVELPPGPIPPVLMGPAVGALDALMIATALAGQRRAWNYGALVTAIALSAQPVAELQVAGAASVAGLLTAIFLLSGAELWGRARIVCFSVFLVGVGGVAVAGTQAMYAAQGLLTPLLEALVDVDGIAGGLGIQSTVSLAPYSNVALSNVRVMELDGAPPRYLRGQVMDQFDGITWSASAEVATVDAARRPPPGGGPPLSMLLHKGMRATIPTPAGTASVNQEPPPLTAGWLVASAPWRGTTVDITRGAERLPAEPAPPAAHTRDLPDELAEALRPIAARLVAGAVGTRQKAAQVEAHFHANHTYSLQSDLRGDAHPLVVLITEQRPAYCAYFASAMAALLRADGGATRVVGGFVPGETNPVTGRTLVRAKDAHAWVEVWIPDEQRWVAFDPTPSREAVLGSARPGLIQAAVEGARDAFMRAFLRVRTDPVGLLRDVLLSWPALALVVLGAGWSLWLRWRGRTFRLRGRRASGAALTDPALWPLYQRYLRLLERRARLSIAPADSDDEILARLREQDPAAARAAAAFLEAYRRARYRREPGADAALRDALEALRSALRRGGGRAR